MRFGLWFLAALLRLLQSALAQPQQGSECRLRYTYFITYLSFLNDKALRYVPPFPALLGLLGHRQ